MLLAAYAAYFAAVYFLLHRLMVAVDPEGMADMERVPKTVMLLLMTGGYGVSLAMLVGAAREAAR